jgi:DNA primase
MRKTQNLQLLQDVFEYFQGGFRTTPLKKNLKNIGLDHEVLKQAEIYFGYNSAQFHHREKKDIYSLEKCLKLGLLSENPHGGYRVWGKNGIILPLQDKKKRIVNLFSFKLDQPEVNLYLNDEGLFPNYPDSKTRNIILTKSIIDACLIIQVQEIKEKYSILTLDGFQLTEEFLSALKELKELEEIILIQGEKQDAFETTCEVLQNEFPQVSLSIVILPDGEASIQSLLLSNEPAIIPHLIEQRNYSMTDAPVIKVSGVYSNSKESKSDGRLDIINPYNFQFASKSVKYNVLGGLRGEMDSMRITLMIENKESRKKSRKKLDLYEDLQIEKTCHEVGEKLGIRTDLLETDIVILTDLLDNYRNLHFFNDNQESRIVKLNVEDTKSCKAFLSQPNLLTRLNKEIEQSGIIGEETSRLFLFIIASSYKMPEPLNALIQGSSGSGKTHLLNKVLELIPSEDVIVMTRVSDKSFYNFPEDFLDKKIIGLEDLDGVSDEALLAFRELQSRGQLTSSVSCKDKHGGTSAKVKIVRGSIASVSCTTKGSVYEDNLSRCFLIAVDESDEQTEKIIAYQNKKSAGKVNKEEQLNTQRFLQNCIRALESVEVINPFAEMITLPKDAHKIRRLNQLYQSFVKQITAIHQFQRKKDKQGRVVSEKMDLKLACDLMFESIVLKVDELDGSLRSFFERLKSYVKDQALQVNPKSKEEEVFQSHTFTQREVRFSVRQSKSQLQRYFNELLDLEYIRLSSRDLKGFKYRIIYWDDLGNIKKKTRKYLNDQLTKL